MVKLNLREEHEASVQPPFGLEVERGTLSASEHRTVMKSLNLTLAMGKKTPQGSRESDFKDCLELM